MADVDANTQFGGFLTQMGINRRDNAVAQNRTWRITHMLLGDGGGRLPTPDPHATGLVNEVYRAPINHLYQDPDNPGILIVEMVIPPEIGGWWIRELGAEDEDGHFVAAANCPPSYKPQLPQGSTRDQTVRMRLITSHIDHIELKIDPSIVTASRAWVEVHVDERAATAAETEAGESERKFITPKILKPLLDTLGNAISTVAQTLTQHRSSGDHDERYARRGQNLGDLTNSGTARSNLGLGTMATRAAGTGGNSFRTNSENDARFAQRANNLSDLNNAGTARSNLGLGSAATRAVGTGSGSNVPDISGADGRYARRGQNLSDLTNAGTARNNLGLGAAAKMGTTASRTSTSTSTLLQAASMNNHRTSGDHDNRYLRSGVNQNGSNLTNLNASNLASGTVPAARLPASATVTKSSVLSATAGASAGAVGTYAFLNRNQNAGAAFGETVPGSQLRPTNADQHHGPTHRGTWRCMGQIFSGGDSWRRSTLWLRIS